MLEHYSLKTFNTMPKHMVGNLKPNKVSQRKAGHSAHSEFAGKSDRFGNRRGNKVPVPKATAKVTHSS